jgi:trehalose 6-phosphate synthase
MYSDTGRVKEESGRLLLVSNRGPVEHFLDESGRIKRRDAGGGVAVALASVARSQPVTWVAGACSFADRIVALTGRPVPIGRDSELKLVNLPEDAFAPFYHSFCNPILWFVQHSMAEHLRRRDLATECRSSWEDGYVPVNRMFAEAVLDAIEGDGSDCSVMLHDYHLYLLPRLLRERRPGLTLQQFVHIPWPAPQHWLSLPADIVRQICRGLLGNDSVTFHTDESVENFLATCRVYLSGEAQVSERRGEIEHEGVTTSVWSNPISVDVPELQSLMASPEVRGYRSQMEETGRKRIVRVDRLDPSKNVLRGFEAYRRLLEKQPRLRGEVEFHAYLVPSRSGIGEYDDYAARVFGLIDDINRTYARPGWTPVSVYYEQNRAQAFAGLATYDVLLVNSVADGMNLVSKEGAIVNEKDGVLVLSITAGSCEELRHGAILIDPFDVEGTAAGLAKALSLDAKERSRRAYLLRSTIEHHQLGDWLRHQLKDLSVATYVRGLSRETAAV